MARTVPTVKADDEDLLVAPKRVAQLLDVSRSQVDRIAIREGWARVYLSNADRGSVRYRLHEILEFIRSRTLNGNR